MEMYSEIKKIIKGNKLNVFSEILYYTNEDDSVYPFGELKKYEIKEDEDVNFGTYCGDWESIDSFIRKFKSTDSGLHIAIILLNIGCEIGSEKMLEKIESLEKRIQNVKKEDETE